MSFDTIRINELAKELKMTSKEVIEKLAQISITGKTHSSTLTVDQVKRLKDFINAGSVKQVKKPKAFIVKKAKVVAEEAKKEEEKAKAEKAEKEKKAAEPEVKRPKIEVVKPKSRLEIVRRAPRPQVNADGTTSTPQRTPYRKDGEGRNFPPRGQRPDGERPRRPFPPRDGQGKPTDGKRPERPERTSGSKKPIERHIIPQDIYEGKSGVGAKKRPDSKRKDKEYNQKEEQERISFEKAAAQ